MKLPIKLSLIHLVCLTVAFQGRSQFIEKMPDDNWWTMSNLNVEIPGSYCYNDSTTYCEKYGRLYTFEAAKKVCGMMGEGWHIPSTEEWHGLLNHFGGAFNDSLSDGKRAFAELLRTESPTFGATLAGNKNRDGTYSRIEGHGFYWTSTMFDKSNAGFLNFANGRKVLFLQPDMETDRAISVRCVKSER